MTPADGAWEAVRLSLAVGALATLCAAPPAVAVGLWLARATGPRRAAVQVAVMAPLVLPPVVTGYGLLLLLGPNGPLATLWQVVPSPAFTFAGAVIASAVVGFPLFVRAVRQAAAAVDPGLVEAARTLGATPLRALLTVTLPLAAPGILSGALLCFARSLGEFGATIVFAGSIAGRTRTLPLAIYRALQLPGGEAIAMQLAAVSVALAIGAVLISEISVRRDR